MYYNTASNKSGYQTYECNIDVCLTYEDINTILCKLGPNLHLNLLESDGNIPGTDCLSRLNWLIHFI